MSIAADPRLEVHEETCEKGVVERRVRLHLAADGDGDPTGVPGIHWLPESPRPTHPTVLVGHGGTQHKRAPNVLGLARTLVRHLGYGVVALDAPGHGDRRTDEQRAAQQARLEAIQRDGRLPVDRAALAALAEAAPRARREWVAALDALRAEPAWAEGPFGYWGLSMGCVFGVPLLASEPRLSAAVIGLAGARDDRMLEVAARITQPLLFLFQADDELMSLESGLALWQALGSTEKALHVNPGPHIGVPAFERDAAVAFFERHLGSAR